jgi:hypothetical protein
MNASSMSAAASLISFASFNGVPLKQIMTRAEKLDVLGCERPSTENGTM